MQDGRPPPTRRSDQSDPGAFSSQQSYHWSLPEVKIVLLYLVLASLWIVGSDHVLASTVVSETEIGVIQSLKGLNFVLTTAILLFFVLRKAYSGWRLAEERRLAVIKHANERYRNLCSRVQSLREEDRTRIAREIHDELGQFLTGIKMELRMIENTLSDKEDRSLNPVIDKLVETTEMVDSTIESVQRISAGLRPSVLDHLGLATALAEEASQFALRSGIACEIEVERPVEPMSPEVETAIFRIFQESLTNVARHAKARSVLAQLSDGGGIMKLRIVDDGIGLDMAELENPMSLGLIGMLERAEAIGGTLAIRRGAEKGTEVLLAVPLTGKPVERSLIS